MQRVLAVFLVAAAVYGAEGSLLNATATPAGTGTDVVCTMQAAVPIPLAGLSGTDLTMAKIFNSKGTWLYQQAAKMRVRPMDLAAVLKVESGGDGFSQDGRMIVRFENHIFYRYFTDSGKDAARVATFNNHYQYDKTTTWQGHMWRRKTTDPWTSFHGNQAKEWEVIVFSQGLDDTAALQSHSMGSPQIMGFNSASVGYPSVQKMFTTFSTSLEAQLNGMVDFIMNHANCINGLRDGDYKKFAGCYNGAGQAEAYGKLIADAAASYAKVSAKRCSTSTGQTGECKAAGSKCTGSTFSGFCATSSDICCVGELQPSPQTEIHGFCTASGGSGVCIDSGKCTGTTYTGLCPGADNIRCCVSTANAVSYGDCTMVSSEKGQCVDPQSCNKGSARADCPVSSVCCPNKNICSAAWSRR